LLVGAMAKSEPSGTSICCVKLGQYDSKHQALLVSSQ
jgi:hypothetical protein